ncbi:DUF805 domain-containing protein [Ramlibacter tataouinensis]|uniref:Candidate membrane protein n=1 Tax=Ramlibacter tataouinensis (strain ATCC BAA-407 / DSM 14655 / LMG 21543 / TTB310) TaxID=365046 RepID=F5XY06_RAMTT|nr:DUF805 domain-containing protein [Ramlibacter tataouinensis]AEG94331.1 candidate membrane protein [Ramlibacter tataouinensis TTB310]
MHTANPYAPPRAAVADVGHDPGVTAPVKNWSAQGRIGRLRYLAHLTGAYVLLALVGFVAGFIAAMLKTQMAVPVAVGAALIAYLWFTVLKTIQRSHDMDWSGWTSLLALIPLVGLVWVFKAGTAGGNRFGLPPPPNSLGVKILGLLFPIVAGIGIVAAIALPAYQDYTTRARAAQQR